jgi:hypothetical protein
MTMDIPEPSNGQMEPVLSAIVSWLDRMTMAIMAGKVEAESEHAEVVAAILYGVAKGLVDGKWRKGGAVALPTVCAYSSVILAAKEWHASRTAEAEEALARAVHGLSVVTADGDAGHQTLHGAFRSVDPIEPQSSARSHSSIA